MHHGRMIIKYDPSLELDREPGKLAVGGLLGGLAAWACCILPLVLFSLGVSGVWIANLTQLAPYQPYVIVATLACLGGGYWLVCRANLRRRRGLRKTASEPPRHNRTCDRHRAGD